MFSCSLGVEWQNRPNPSKVAFPHLKYPAPNPLRFVCHAPVSPDVRKYNPFAPLSFTPCSQDESIALPSFHSHSLHGVDATSSPILCLFLAAAACFWERSFRAWLRLLSAVSGTSVLSLAFIRDSCCHSVLN